MSAFELKADVTPQSRCDAPPMSASYPLLPVAHLPKSPTYSDPSHWGSLSLRSHHDSLILLAGLTVGELDLWEHP